MGKIDVDDRGMLRVQLQSGEDIAALRAALRSVQGTSAYELNPNQDITVDAENPANLVALHGAGFEWSHAALARALDELMPYAAANITMHASTNTKVFRRMMADAQAASRSKPGQSADATTSPP